ncbi:MAG TPA: DUF4173 domain-containing protein [Gaiellaceae bacterium]|nr:DUF4173 domain-containing protein [Gaiellaceae bacterium]
MRSAAVAAAAAAAALLPGEPLGIGVALVGVLVAASVAAVVERPTVDAVLFGAAALTLAAAPALRDAGWVVAIDLTAAWLLASAAVAGPRLAAVAAPLVRLRSVPALAPPVPRGVAPGIRGAVLGGLLALPFGALFWSADAAFAEVLRGIPLPSVSGLPGRAVAFVLVLLAALGLGLAARRPLRGRPLRPRRRLGVWEWAIPLALLDALFLAFVAVQVTVLFGGHDHVLHTAGLTYAEYARQGFWQLLAAGALTLAVVAGADLLADVSSRRDALLVRALLGVLCALAIVVLVSALHRLRLYEDAYGLTRARLAAEAFALWLGGLFGVLIAAGIVDRVLRQLPRVVLVGTAAALVAFTLANPDGLIAQRNVERWRETGRLDVAYLQTLSADAAPALAGLPTGLRNEALAPLASRLADDESLSSANLSRHRARAQLFDPAGG